MKRSLFSLGFFVAFMGSAMADTPEFDPTDRLAHESLELRPVSLPLGGTLPGQPLDNIQKTMAIVAVCSLVLSAISLGYRISQDQKKT